MIKLRSIILCLLISGFTGLKAQDHVDKIAEEACTCIEEFEEKDREELKIKMGLCIISSAQPYERQLKRKNGIDLSKLESGGDNSTRLGQLIGMKMAGKCPDVLMRVSGDSRDSDRGAGSGQEVVLGKVVAVNTAQFVTLQVKNNQTSGSYIWLERFENSSDFKDNPAILKGKNVEISYRIAELFDPQTGMYRKFKVITGMVLK